MLEFFDAVSRAFARNRDSSEHFAYFLAGLIALAAGWLVFAAVRQRRTTALRFDDFVHQRGLGDADAELSRELARAARVDAMDLVTHLDVFEHATSAALAGSLELHARGNELGARLHHLRQALHFDRLPAHAPLLSSRELVPGTALDCGEVHGQVVEVDEETFAVELSGQVSLPRGDEVTLRVRHAREAVYRLRCRLIDGDGRHLRLAHDEGPERVQQRQFARVEHRAIVTLKVVSWPGHALPATEVTAEVRDVSAGGALLATPRALPAGVVVTTATPVRFGKETFRNLRAVVLSSEVRGAETLLHLEFTGVNSAERDRLVAAVNSLPRPEKPLPAPAGRGRPQAG